MLGRVSTAVKLSRPINSYIAPYAFIVGWLVAVPKLDSVSNLQAITSVLILILVHASVTIENDIADQTVDATNNVDRPITRRQISAQDALYLSLLLISTAAIIAFFSPQRWQNISFISLFVFIGWLYNNPPIRLNFRPIGSIVTLALAYAMLPLVYGLVIGGYNKTLYIAAVFIIAWGLQRASVSILKDYKDVVGDKKVGKSTFLLRYGKRKTALTSLYLASLGYASVVFALMAQAHNIDALVLATICGTTILAVYGLYLRRQLLAMSQFKLLTKQFYKIFRVHKYLEMMVIACLATSLI